MLWFRRDLRLADHPALTRAAATGAVVPVFVLDPRLLRPAGPPRVAFLLACLRELDAALAGGLVVRSGRPEAVLPALAREVGAAAVFATGDDGPYGRTRDAAVAAALGGDGRELHLVDSPYAVPPGRVRKADGTEYRVFTAFHRAWREHGWADPIPEPAALTVARGVPGEAIPAGPAVPELPEAGPHAAHARLADFVEERATTYAQDRDRPDRDRTSHLSPYLRFGCLHPRQVLAALSDSPGEVEVVRQLAWRDFYADVVLHHPESVREPLHSDAARVPVDRGPVADRRFDAWAAGQTGYPIVDAGMRQLLAQSWMPNRVRMIVASFLVKDLHLDWRRGARWFMAHLVDGDLASNAHGWQWVAGTGTDAAPYHRIFNPVTQGRRYDPDGDYVRRWVPELAGIPGAAVHEPWHRTDPVDGYPAPLVDHAAERRDALARLADARARRRGAG